VEILNRNIWYFTGESYYKKFIVALADTIFLFLIFKQFK
jgi:hypothetical protein